jgi:hypothetical protein
LVGLQLVEPGDAGFHLLGIERFCSHGGSSNSRDVRTTPLNRRPGSCVSPNAI